MSEHILLLGMVYSQEMTPTRVQEYRSISITSIDQPIVAAPFTTTVASSTTPSETQSHCIGSTQSYFDLVADVAPFTTDR